MLYWDGNSDSGEAYQSKFLILKCCEVQVFFFFFFFLLQCNSVT